MADEQRSGCPINLTLEVVGDKWSLLVIRDMMFGNRRHFRELLTKSEEGISSNILADRLKTLLDQGVITKEKAQQMVKSAQQKAGTDAAAAAKAGKSSKKPAGTEIAGNAMLDASTRLVPGVDFGTTAGDGQSPDPAKLVDGGETAHYRIVANFDMAGQRSIVGKDDFVSNPAIVSNVAVSEKISAAADLRFSFSRGAAVDRDEFAERVFVADFQISRLALVFQVLRLLTD